MRVKIDERLKIEYKTWVNKRTKLYSTLKLLIYNHKYVCGGGGEENE